MKRVIKTAYFLGIILQIGFLVGSPLFALAADPVIGARLITPADRREGYVAYMKSQAPQLTVTFDKTAFREGEEVTAQAVVTGFKDHPEELYYTWYLKRSGCDLKSTKAECDNDGDGKVTVNDWKIEAARLVAKNGFEKKDANYGGSGDSDDDGFEVEPSLDDWEMPYKSKNDVEVPDCYIQDFERGRFYELRETTPVFNCASGGVAACGKDEQINCSGELRDICGQSSDQICKVEDDANVENFTAEVQCPQEDGLPASDQKNPVCGEPGKTLFGYVQGNLTNNAAICQALADNEEAGGRCAVVKTGTPSCTFKKSNNLCKHLFPTQVAPKDLDSNSIQTGDGEFDVEEEEFWGTDPANKSTKGNGQPDEANVVGLGAKTFTWTYINGDQIGLAVEGTSANPTKHDDGSYMRTWVFSKNTCKELKDNIKELRAFYIEYQEVPRVNAGFLTTTFDLNDCLEENLIDPTGGGIGTLQVNVTASPENPINDPSQTGRGDTIRAQATVAGAENPSSLYYDWKIEASSKGASIPTDESWIDITDKVSQKSIMQGFDVKDVQFKLDIAKENFPMPDSPQQYIRVKLKVSENAASNMEQNRVGRGTAVFKATQLDKEIIPYLVNVSSDGKVTLDKSQPICQNQSEIAVCPVTENRIIGLSVPNEDDKLVDFSWKIDGKSVVCDQQLSADCSGSGSETIFFPATGVIGNTFDVSLSAKDVDTGLVKTMTRKFEIVEPSMQISSANEELVWPKQLGVYKDLSGNETPDLSNILFQTNSGNTVALKAEFYPQWIKGYAQYSWKVNGEQQLDLENADLEFQAVQAPGSTYNIETEATYMMASNDEQVINTRKALANNWGISPQNATEGSLESSIQVEVVAGAEEIAKANGSIFASIVSNIPGETMFLLRLILTIGALILVTGMVFAATPEFGEKKK